MSMTLRQFLGDLNVRRYELDQNKRGAGNKGEFKEIIVFDLLELPY